MATTDRGLLDRPLTPPVHYRARLLPPGWPVFAVLYGYPLWWALGLSNFAWVIASAPMLLWLLAQPHTRLPKGTGIWALFLAWIVPSLFLVDSGSSALVWGYRLSLYVASGVAFIYAYNLPRSSVSSRSITRAMSALWIVIVVSGLLALLVPQFTINTLMQQLLPASLTSDPFVESLIHASIAQIHDFLGFAVARPAAPFSYTNSWGSNLALLTPMAVVFILTLSGWKRVAMAALSVVALFPVIQSLNRGLWVSLGVGLAYTAVRFLFAGRARRLGVIVSGLAIATLVTIATPLGGLVGAWLETGHSDARRASLYEQSIEAAAASPLLGHGGTVPDVSDPDGPPVGTHGQLWVLLVSHGFPATAVFLAFLAYALFRTRSMDQGRFVFATHVMLVIAVTQLGFYFLIPSQLPMLMVATGVSFRETATAAK